MKDKSVLSAGRVPLSVHSAFERMHITESKRTVEHSLSGTTVPRFTLQDFYPLYQSLEWEFSEFAWKNLGVLPFAESNVPFIVTNSGRLSEHAAAVLYESCRLFPPDGPFCVLELGSGSGLFARLLLDAFRTICAQQGTDYYDRLTYVATDGSPESIRQWQERGVFDEHSDRVQSIPCDANSLRDLPELGSGTVRAVFCNYVLDVLPSTIVRKRGGVIEELVVRTHLVDDAATLAQHTELQPEEIRTLASATDPEQRRKLLPLLSLLELETNFRPLDGPSFPYFDWVSTQWNIDQWTVVNFGALGCIEACLELLGEIGFVLINDYGSTNAEQELPHSASQRFGPTLALGINFALMETFFGREPWTVHVPNNDSHAPLHARLIIRREITALADSFNNRFGHEGQTYFEQPLEEAREHVAAGRKNEALEAYKLALSRNRGDWHMLGEIAEYVGLQLRDAEAGMKLAQEAVRLNPWYSPWLWNVLGDCLFCQNRFRDAHVAYLQAHHIDPSDSRTNYNLAFTHTEFREYEAALSAIGRGLAHDRDGLHREHLLEKQRQILSALSARTLSDHERLMRRSLSQR